MISQQINRPILLLSIAMLSACGKQEPAKPQPRPAMVTQPISAGLLLNSYAGDVTARVQPQLSFRVGGKVIKRWVDVGNTVKAGQILAELDPQDAQLQRTAAAAQLASAESAERVAKSELDRYKQLLAPNAISRSQYDQVENQYKSAASALQQAKSQYDVASNQANYNTLRAPENGVIVQRQVEAGQVVTAGQPIYTLAAQGDREVVIGLPEQDLPRFHIGQHVTVTVWSQPDARFPAHVRELSPAADQSHTFAARIAFDQPNPSVDIGQSARVYAADPKTATALSIPLSAVTAEQGAAYVWVLNPSTSVIKRTFIKTGAYDRDIVPVLSGLNPSDWVVVAGVQLLHDGQKIQPVDRQNRPVTATTGTQSTPVVATAPNSKQG
ncbi:efflux RND transporter periplasmic adaptor subunit [Aquirhabdus parva]|uniref:Efflux RND transporter periplasmic adaptor subunit n=1 Tax=Aquirhabdus parva TaxID=2283318 RepID=A0A345P2Y7_9GAMM|nr:efflux RND transporter periplasmic adaptor subunit [Aquirhabdus parva]AXI01646.1 efflux RND transporter periplasmic adaptor subunit [Aquirhabdus parva]